MKTKSESDAYRKTIAAARKAGGNKVQSHWQARLKAVQKAAHKPAKAR